MVGLRLGSGFEALEGDCVGEEVVPWAAALSDRLLSSHCTACFCPCSTSRLPCPGSCEGAVVYCSPSCRSLDLPLHVRFAECNLFALLRSSVSPVSSSNFPSLGGTCDIRAALRLLARHHSLNHISTFLATSESPHGMHSPRLGGLLSNRSILLQISSSKNSEDDEERQLANELGEAALLMLHVLYSAGKDPYAQQSDFHSEHNPAVGVRPCVAERRESSVFCEDADRQPENSLTMHRSMCENGLRQAEVCSSAHENMEGTEFWELLEAPGGVDHDLCTDMDPCGGADPHASKEEEATNAKLTSPSHAKKLRLVQEVLCQVFTNGVRVHTDTWISDGLSNVQSKDLGTAVYGPAFSWINHSCKPNAFFSFGLVGKNTPKESTFKAPLHPDLQMTGLEDTWGLRSAFPYCERVTDQGYHWFQYYGPRAQLRAIRRIKGDETVCVSYIDLLQRKGIRRRDLWLKYHFHCNCERCEEESPDSVDSILEKLGPDGSQCDILLQEEWLQDKTERGLREFLENDSPSACCKILEDAMTELVHEAYCCHSNVKSSQCWPVQNSNRARIQDIQVSPRHQRRLRLHLMHYLCLEIYMTLTLSYKILAIGYVSSSDEGPSTCNTAACLNEVLKRRKVKCSMASAAYSLFLAMTVQHLCDLDEPGLMAIASWFWLQSWEALIILISQLDNFFHVDSMHEMQNLLSTCISEFKSIVFCQDKNFICMLMELLRTCHNLQSCVSNKQLLQGSAMALWPFLRSASPFLSNIETPFGGSIEVSISTNGLWTDSLKIKDNWLCCRGEALICAICSLRHCMKLMNILHGSGNELLEVMQNFLAFVFGVGRSKVI